MSTLFDDLKQGLQEAIAYEKGQGTARIKTYTIAPVKEYSSAEIRDIRMKAGMTQSVFAAYMGVSKKTVEAKHGKIAQTVCRLIGSKTGKHKVKNLKGEAKKKYYSIPETDRLTKHDIEQGTITVSNLGSICRDWNGACTLLEIIPPQTCAIAIGSIQKKPVVDENGNVVAGNVMPLTIAFDHRAFDLGDVKPFMEKLNEIFLNPEVIKEWL